MAGTSFKCTKCGKIFRQIHGSTTKELHDAFKDLTTEEKDTYKGDDFFCCGRDNLKTLHELGMIGELQRLQIGWLNIMRKKMG